jgi:lipopolysaccharide biosynthesis glycosyltransferase
MSNEMSTIEAILRSEYFDAEWYKGKYIKKAADDEAAAKHYLQYGVKRNYDPSPRFSTFWYLTKYGDVQATGMNPLLHYEQFGKFENRPVFPLDNFIIEESVFWNDAWYRSTFLNNDTSVDAVAHYLEHGAAGETDPCPYFSSKDYFEENADIQPSSINPLLHYEVYGRFEFRNIVKWEMTLERIRTGVYTGRGNPPAQGTADGKADIKIFVCCATDSYVPDHPLLKPVQAGAALREERFHGMQPDDEGDNISDRNPYYCEMTAHYWAWKNADADYFGFFHHRRYLSFEDGKLLPEDPNSCVRFDSLNDFTMQKLRLEEAHMREIIENHDIVVMTPHCFALNPLLAESPTIYAQYDLSPDHFIGDLDLAVSILLRDHPEYKGAAEEYLAMSEGIYLNMYIMKKKYFHMYNEILFPLLEEVYTSVDFSERNVYGKRFVGFVAERMLGIFLLHLLKTQEDLRVHYAQFALFDDVSLPGPVEIKPAFEKDSVAIALASDDNYALPLIVTVQSILTHASENKNYDFLIFDDGIQQSRKNTLLAMVKNHANASIRFLNKKNYQVTEGLKTKDHISEATYIRFLILDVLKNYSKILYLDCDLVVNDDVAKLYETDVTGYMAAAVRDTIMAGWCHSHSDLHDGYLKYQLNIGDPSTYFNAGVLLINVEELGKRYSAGDLYFLAAGQEFRWMDQDILNMVCSGHVKLCDPTWNVMINTSMIYKLMSEEMIAAFEQSLKNAKIVHYAGSTTPCFSPGHPREEDFWQYAKETSVYEELRALAEQSAAKARNAEL